MRSRRVSFSDPDDGGELVGDVDAAAAVVAMSPDPSAAGSSTAVRTGSFDDDGGGGGGGGGGPSSSADNSRPTSPHRRRQSRHQHQPTTATATNEDPASRRRRPSCDSCGGSSLATEADVRLPADLFKDDDDDDDSDDGSSSSDGYCSRSSCSAEDDEDVGGGGTAGGEEDGDGGGGGGGGGRRQRRRRHRKHRRRSPRGKAPPPAPPDGGWGWAVVFASFMIHIVTDGVTYTFGNFFPEFLKEFKNNRSNTSWIISILAGVTLGSGPLVSALSNKYDCQKVTVVGAILASICLFASSFAVNISTLYITIGIGTGLGLGCIYLPAIVMVTTYFDKKRAFATGMAVCGSGVGTLIFAPLTEYLIATHGWRWALTIVAAIVLSCIVFAAIFRPLRRREQANKGESQRRSKGEGGQKLSAREAGHQDAETLEHLLTAEANGVCNRKIQDVEASGKAVPDLVIVEASSPENSEATEDQIAIDKGSQQDPNEKTDSAYQSSVSSNEAGQDAEGVSEVPMIEHTQKEEKQDLEKNNETTNGSRRPLISPSFLFSWQKNPRLRHLDLFGLNRAADVRRSLPMLEQSTPASIRKQSFPAVHGGKPILFGRRRASSEAPDPAYNNIVRHDPSGSHLHLKPPTAAGNHVEMRSPSSLATRKNLGFGLGASSMLALQVRQSSLALHDHAGHHTHHHQHLVSQSELKRRRSSAQAARRSSVCHPGHVYGTAESSRLAKSAEPPRDDMPKRPPSPIPDKLCLEDSDRESQAGDAAGATTRSSARKWAKACRLKCAGMGRVARTVCPKDLASSLSEMLNLSILKDSVFLLYTISNFITSVGYIVPYCFLMDRASLELGIDSQVASNILGMIGMASMGGRLVFGFLADRVCFNRLWLYIGCVSCCGIATFSCPWARDEYTLTLYAVVFGATSGAYVGLSSVILVDLMGSASTGIDDKLVNAFGMLLLFQGAATTVGPPIGGWVTDMAGNSDATFHLAGALIAFSSALLSVTPFVINNRNKTRANLANISVTIDNKASDDMV